MGKPSNSKVVELNSEERLMNKLSDPETIKQLNRLLDRTEQMNLMFEYLESFLERGPDIADSINSLLVDLRQEAEGENYLEQISGAIESLRKIHAFVETEEFKQLEATLLRKEMVEMVTKISRSFVDAQTDVSFTNDSRVSIFSLLRDIRDPEIQPALQYLMSFAKNLSKELDDA